MRTRLLIVTAVALLLGFSAATEAGWHHRYHRYVGYSAPVFNYSPYALAPAYSLHGPAVYPGYSFASYRSYYSPINYGYVARYRPLLGGYRVRGFYGAGFTRYGVYGGSYGYVPLTVGYPYATGYLSAVRPIRPYLTAYPAGISVPVVTPVTTAYSPCMYGAYGLGGY